MNNWWTRFAAVALLAFALMGLWQQREPAWTVACGQDFCVTLNRDTGEVRFPRPNGRLIGSLRDPVR